MIEVKNTLKISKILLAISTFSIIFASGLNFNNWCNEFPKVSFRIEWQPGNSLSYTSNIRIKTPQNRGLSRCCPSVADLLEQKTKYSISNVPNKQYFSIKFRATSTPGHGGHALQKVTRETPLPYAVALRVSLDLISKIKSETMAIVIHGYKGVSI
jgi:hypothetical protein